MNRRLRFAWWTRRAGRSVWLWWMYAQSTRSPRLLAERLRAIQPEIAILFFSSLADGDVIRLGILDSERGVLRQEGVVNA